MPPQALTDKSSFKSALPIHERSPSVDSLSKTESDGLLRSEYETHSDKIMMVDDEPLNIKAVKKHLGNAGYGRFESTSDPREAMAMIRCNRPDVLLLDIVMPHINGLHILEAVRGDLELHHLPVLILTANSDEETKLSALHLGATDILNKPIKFSELVLRVRNSLTLKNYIDQQADYSNWLEQEVRRRTAELEFSRYRLIHVVACAAEHHDTDTGNHVLRVGRYAGIIARQIGINEVRSELIEQAAILHDVGKIGIRDAILLKPDKLTVPEFDEMKNHCAYGLSILRGKRMGGGPIARNTPLNETISEAPILEIAAAIVMSHHEKWDGSGYPLGLSETLIPIEGRITAVADVFDALSSRRPYKKALPLDRCFEILEEGRGTHFDPRVLDAFLACRSQILEVAQTLADRFDEDE